MWENADIIKVTNCIFISICHWREGTLQQLLREVYSELSISAYTKQWI